MSQDGRRIKKSYITQKRFELRMVVIHRLLGCDTVQSGSHLPAFRGTMLPPPTAQKNKLLRVEHRFPCGSAELYMDLRFYPEGGSRRFLRNVGKLSLDYAVSHIRIQYAALRLTHTLSNKNKERRAGMIVHPHNSVPNGASHRLAGWRMRRRFGCTAAACLLTRLIEVQSYKWLFAVKVLFSTGQCYSAVH